MTDHQTFRLAIIADAHFHDPRGDFGGAGVAVDGERLVLRPWSDTEAGIRAVNESAAALTAAAPDLKHLGAFNVGAVDMPVDTADTARGSGVRR